MADVTDIRKELIEEIAKVNDMLGFAAKEVLVDYTYAKGGEFMKVYNSQKADKHKLYVEK